MTLEMEWWMDASDDCGGSGRLRLVMDCAMDGVRDKVRNFW